jgi:hypothetical protein
MDRAMMVVLVGGPHVDLFVPRAHLSHRDRGFLDPRVMGRFFRATWGPRGR